MTKPIIANLDQDKTTLANFPDHYAQFYEPIGHFIISFSSLEQQVHHAISRFLHLGDLPSSFLIEEALAFQIKNFRGRIDLLSSIMHLRIPEGPTRDQFNDIIKQIRELNDFRNNLVHGPWQVGWKVAAPDEKIATKVRFSAQKKLTWRSREITARQINQKTKQITQTLVDLVNAYAHYRPASLQKKSRSPKSRKTKTQ